MRRGGVLARVGGVEPVDVRQQDQRVGAGHLGDAGGQPVVVAEADLGGGDGVVLVDDGDAAELEQGAERGAGIQVAAAVLAVLEREQELRGRQPLGRERIRPGAGQADLPDRGGGLLLLQLQLLAGQAEGAAGERDGAGGDQDDLGPPRTEGATSAATLASQAARGAAVFSSTTRAEPIFTTTRRAPARAGSTGWQVLRFVGQGLHGRPRIGKAPGKGKGAPARGRPFPLVVRGSGEQHVAAASFVTCARKTLSPAVS